MPPPIGSTCVPRCPGHQLADADGRAVARRSKHKAFPIQSFAQASAAAAAAIAPNSPNCRDYYPCLRSKARDTAAAGSNVVVTGLQTDAASQRSQPCTPASKLWGPTRVLTRHDRIVIHRPLMPDIAEASGGNGLGEQTCGCSPGSESQPGSKRMHASAACACIASVLSPVRLKVEGSGTVTAGELLRDMFAAFTAPSATVSRHATNTYWRGRRSEAQLAIASAGPRQSAQKLQSTREAREK